MIYWILNLLKRLILGQTDLDGNGIPDSKDIARMIQAKLDKKKEKKDKKIIKKLLK